MKSSKNVPLRSYPIFLAVFLALFLMICAVDLGGIQTLRRAGMSVRFERVDLEGFRQAGIEEERPETISYFSRELTTAGIGRLKGDVEKIRFVQNWVMNQVKKTDLDTSSLAIEAFEKAKGGQGLACGSMSRIYVAALRSVGIKARKVQLVRSPFNDRDTHVTTEVLMGGHWIIFDPTFNVSYRKGGKLIGAEEMRESILDGSHDKVHPVFYGEVKYPARLEKYYLDWMAPYNNILIFEDGKHGLLSKLPPFRFWFGPKFYYLETSPAGLWHFEAINQSYFVFYVVLPMLAFLLLAIFSVFWLFPGSKERRR